MNQTGVRSTGWLRSARRNRSFTAPGYGRVPWARRAARVRPEGRSGHEPSTGSNAAPSPGVEPTDERTREDDGWNTETEPRLVEGRRSAVVEGPARPAAAPGAVRLDRGGSAPARARRLGLPAVRLVLRERTGRGQDPRPLVHALGGRDDVPQRRVAAARPGPARRGRAGGRLDLRGARRREPVPRGPARVGARNDHADP